jgi:hypothetical protein
MKEYVIDRFIDSTEFWLQVGQNFSRRRGCVAKKIACPIRTKVTDADDDSRSQNEHFKL